MSYTCRSHVEAIRGEMIVNKTVGVWIVLGCLPLLASQKRLPLATPAQQAKAEAARPVAAREKELNDLLEEIWQNNLRQSPEFASSIGDNRYNDKISDYSIRAYNDELAREQEYLLRLAAINTQGFSDQERISYDLELRQLMQDQEASEFKEWQMPVNQMGGIYSEYPELVRQLSFNSVKDYDDWIARLHAIPHAFDQVTEEMEIGMEEKRMPPKYLLEQTLTQVSELAHQKPEDSPLAMPLQHFPASVSPDEQKRIRAEMLAVIGNEVLPAYLRFEHFMQVSYVPAGRTDPGVWSLPDGERYYEFCIRRETTTKMTPAQIHQIGLDEVKRDEAEMLAIAKEMGYADLKSFRAAIAINPKLHPVSADALLEAYRGYEQGMEAKLPSLFTHLPKAQLEVVTIPAYRAKNAAAAYYEEGTADGSRPGRITVNTYNATKRTLTDVEAIAYHEGVPGHHLQISIAEEMQGVPEFRKYVSYTAFVEGWALYAERLGKEIGFYRDPYSDYGRLDNDEWRAIRLVVDTGVHSMHWTRQQMVDYFHEHSSLDETNIQSEVDRYIGWPGQALAYKVGQLKILELRDRARQSLGTKFDLSAFHDEVIDSGALPLDVLEKRVDDWISAQGGRLPTTTK